MLTIDSLMCLGDDLSAGRIMSGLLKRGKCHDMGFIASLGWRSGEPHSGHSDGALVAMTFYK